MVQGQFLPEAWGFAMACHRLPDLVSILDFYIAKLEHYMFKHNKHEEEKEKEKKKDIYAMIRKKQLREVS